MSHSISINSQSMPSSLKSLMSSWHQKGDCSDVKRKKELRKRHSPKSLSSSDCITRSVDPPTKRALCINAANAKRKIGEKVFMLMMMVAGVYEYRINEVV
jgi:hypothetical protein